MFKPSLATQTHSHPYKLQVQHTSGPRRNLFSTRVLDNWKKKQTYISISSHINISISQLQTQ